MAKRIGEFCLALLLLLSLVEFTLSVDPPESPPSPAPESGADAPSPLSSVPTAGGPSPVQGPVASSPPAPTPGNLAPASSRAPTPSSFPADEKPPVPTPEPSTASDINHSGINSDDGEKENSSGGMSEGKKAGIAVGVIAAAFVVGFGGMVYKKRQDNIRRSQYSYTARRDIL